MRMIDKMMAEKWGRLAPLFNTNTDILNPSSADNVVIAWPEIIKLIEKYAPKIARHDISVLDYGCSTGGFCNELYEHGFQAMGIDISAQMVSIARDHSPATIPYILGDFRSLQGRDEQMDVIASVTVFHYMPDLKEAAEVFFNLLKPDGALIFAALNPAFAKCCAEKGVRYKNILENKSPPTATAVFPGDISFDVYLRSEEDYRRIFESVGLKYLESFVAEFPPNFAQQYGWALPTNIPEYLIMAFKKTE